MLILLLAPYIGLVKLDSLTVATKRLSRVDLAHGFAQTVLHEPCGFVSNLQCAMELMRANSFFAGGHQVCGLKPLMQLDMAALENGAYGDGEFPFARSAAAQPSPTTLDHRDAIKAAATRAVRTIGPNDCLKARNRGLFIVEMRLRKQRHGCPRKPMVYRVTGLVYLSSI